MTLEELKKVNDLCLERLRCVGKILEIKGCKRKYFQLHSTNEDGYDEPIVLIGKEYFSEEVVEKMTQVVIDYYEEKMDDITAKLNEYGIVIDDRYTLLVPWASRIKV